jgi:regulator of cell morphogenesis and NO signaling
MEKQGNSTFHDDYNVPHDAQRLIDLKSSQPTDQSSLGDLVAHIEQTHHAFTRLQLSQITTLLDGLVDTAIPAFAEIKHCCVQLQADLIPHLMKEERILFPYIVELENKPAHKPNSCFGSIANPIRMMGIEHETIKTLLTTLRELTKNYLPIATYAPNIKALCAALSELDSDLIQHIQWEDDVLFPRALTLDKELLT